MFNVSTSCEKSTFVLFPHKSEEYQPAEFICDSFPRFVLRANYSQATCLGEKSIKKTRIVEPAQCNYLFLIILSPCNSCSPGLTSGAGTYLAICIKYFDVVAGRVSAPR